MLRLAQMTVGSRAVAEEVTQDTWLAVVRGVERFEGRSSLKTWLFHILVNRHGRQWVANGAGRRATHR
jgi:RNA polymerase sigma-70 factor (ECF subfamily)